MSKKKNKKSNPHSAPQPKAKPTQPAKKSNPLVWGIGAIVVVAILIIAAVVLTQKPSTTSGAQNSANPTATTSADTYTPPALEEDVTYTARIDVKDYGTITVELDQSAAPITCANFVELANSGFYNGLTFHRIMDGFMIQGGDPEGNGTGGSEHEIVGEFSSNGWDNPCPISGAPSPWPAPATPTPPPPSSSSSTRTPPSWTPTMLLSVPSPRVWTWWTPFVRTPSPPTTTAPFPPRSSPSLPR